MVDTWHLTWGTPSPKLCLHRVLHPLYPDSITSHIPRAWWRALPPCPGWRGPALPSHCRAPALLSPRRTPRSGPGSRSRSRSPLDPYPILFPTPRGLPRATIAQPGPAPLRRDQSAPRSAPGPAAGNTLGKRLGQSAPRSDPSPPLIGSRRGEAGGAARTWRPGRG